MIKKIGVMLLIGLLCNTIVFAQSLEELQQTAVKNNHAVHAAEANWHAMENTAVSEGWWPNPQVSYALLNVPTEDPRLDLTPMSGQRLMIMQMIPFWKAPLKGSLSQAMAQAAKAQWVEVTRQIESEVAQAYHELQYLKDAKAILSKHATLFRDLVKVARSKYERGKGLEQDVLQAQVALSLWENKILEIEEQLSTQTAELSARLGGNLPVSDIQINQALTWQPRHILQATLLEHGIEKNAKRMMLQYKHAASLDAQQLASAFWAPDLEVSAYYTFREDVPGDMTQGQDFVGASIGVTLPLWFFTQDLPKLSTAKQLQISSQQAYQEWEQQLKAKLISLAARLQRLEQTQILYAKKVLPTDQLALDASMTAYQVGRIDFLTLVNAETMLANHELEHLRSVADYEKTLDRLYSLTGEKFSVPANKEVFP